METSTIDSFTVSNATVASPHGLNPEWEISVENIDHLHYFANGLADVVQPWSEGKEFLPTIIVYSIAFVCGITGNALVLFALLGDRRAREAETNCFLVSLAVADVLFLAFCVPYNTLLKISGYLPQGGAFCKAAGFIEIFSTAASIWNLTFISIER